MTFIKNRNAWLRWRRKWFQYQSSKPLEPTDYPCFAYTSVGSFGYEEVAENYLYANDVYRMGRQVSRQMASEEDSK